MTVEHENRATIRRYVDELNKRNFAILDRVVAETVSKHGLLRTESEQAPEIVTRQEYAQSIRNRVEEFPDYTVTILDMLAEGDRVMIYWERQFTHGEEFLGVSATGKTIVERAIGIYRLREGRIIEVSALWDQADTWQQLGLIPDTEEILGSANTAD